MLCGVKRISRTRWYRQYFIQIAKKKHGLIFTHAFYLKLCEVMLYYATKWRHIFCLTGIDQRF